MTRIVRAPIASLLVSLLPLACGDAPTDDGLGEGLAPREACGPEELVPNPDADKNSRAHGIVTCDLEAGETLVGIISQDYAWDSLDGIGALCETATGAIREEAYSDLLNPPVPPDLVLCPPGATVVGVAYRDADPVPGVPADTTDAATVQCSGSASLEPNPDLDGNTNALRSFECPAGQDPVGFAYVDLDSPSYSDLTDSITMVCAPSCEECDPTPQTQPNPDFDSNPAQSGSYVCDEDETMIGIVYRDFGWDHVDSVGVRCQDDSGNVRSVTHVGDMSNALGDEVMSVCGPGENVTAIAYKDAQPWAGIPVDLTDGVAVVCDGGAPEAVADLNDNPAHYQTVACPGGLEAAGIEYVDRSVNPYSDLTDAVTIVCRQPCSE